jgi:adenylyltransferase/sulfurtransferase
MTRYSRQISLPQIGPAGQERIAKARVLVFGCGALGSIQAELLARAGVGFLRIVDRDIPDWSNLPRQFLFEEKDVEEQIPKATAAAEKLRRINSRITIESRVMDVTIQNFESLLQGIDLVIDGVDNFEARYLLNDLCVKMGIPWIYGGIQGTNALAMPIIPGVGPCLQCVFPEPPPQGLVPTCDVAGVLNTSPAVAASLQVSQAIRIIVEGGDGRENDVRLVSVDPWTGMAQSILVERHQECLCCVKSKFLFLEANNTSRSATLCGRQAVQISPAQPQCLDLAKLADSLESLGKVVRRREVLEFEVEGMRLVIFPDARVVVHGTADLSVARSLVSRYFGS